METPKARPGVGRYLVGLLAPVAIAGVMQITWPFFQPTPTSLFLLGVMFSAWYGGLGPGLVALCCSIILADYFFVAPYFAFWPPKLGDLVRLVNLVTVGSAISVLSELMHRARRRAENSLAVARRAEEARQLTEQRYQTLFEQAPDGILIADAESHYLDANPSICQMLGYTRAELIGLHASDIVDPAESPNIAEALLEITTKSEHHRQWQFHRKDGSVFTGEVIATLMPDGNLLGMIRDITERRRAEDALRESEDQFRTMANSIPQLAWIARADGFIFWYNQRWHDYTGKTPAEMEGWGWQSVHDPELLPKVVESWQHAIANAQPFEMEFPLRGADGRFRVFLTRVQPLKNALGEVMQWFGTNTDVDELKQMEESLRHQAELLEQSYDAIVVWRLGGAINYWNRGAELLYGFSKAEAIGRITHDLLQTTFPIPRAQFEDELHRENRWEGELQHTTRAGKKITVESRLVVVRQERGAAYVMETNRDITGRKRAADRFRVVVEASPNALVMANEEGRIRLVNAQTERLFGYGRAELLNQPVELLVPERYRAQHRGQRPLYAQDPTTRAIGAGREMFGLCKDGREVPIEIGLNPVHTDEGAFVLASVVDITERKRAEATLLVYSGKLERSNRELQDFAQVASHDLQEPLRKILAFGDRLRKSAGDALNAECRDYLQRIFNATARMQTLITDLMTFSRVETRAQAFVSTDLAVIAREVSSDLETRVEQAGGRIEIETLPTIDADPLQMRQLLQNLIGNSLKYFRPGVPPIVRIYCNKLEERRIGFLREVDPLPQVYELLVTDNGIGFDEKYLDRIFTVFQRLHTKAEYEGTGVGLAICRKIAERHGGSITARSIPGEGATFVVSLPVSHLKEVEVL